MAIKYFIENIDLIAPGFNTGPYDTEQDAIDYLNGFVGDIPTGNSHTFNIVSKNVITIDGTGE